MQLLQDIFIIEELQVLSEGKSDGPMRIRGVFGRCNEKNNNGRIYPTAVLESQLKKVQPLISERRLCGELDHPQNDTVKLSNASHLITKLDMKGNELVGEAEILKTPAGLTAKALVEGGVKIGISSRGMGTLSEDHNGDKVVNEDFRLVTFDLVADPSTRGAYPGLCESTQSKFARESQGKLEKEQNFVTMIQSKLREAYEPWIEEAKKKKDKKSKKNLPGNQEALDVDGDGEIEGEDFAKLRGEAMEAVRREGSWHKLAYAIAEAGGIAAAVDKPKEGDAARLHRTSTAGGDTGSMMGNIRARSHAKKMEIAKAKGARKGASQIAKGDIEAQRIRARGAAGGSVSMNPFSPGRESYAQGTRGLQQRGERIQRSKDRLAAGTPKPRTDPAAAAPKPSAAAPKPEAEAKPTPQQAALADVQSGGPKAPAPKQEVQPEVKPEVKTQTGRMSPDKMAADAAEREGRATAGRSDLQKRLAIFKKEKARKQSAKTAARTAGERTGTGGTVGGPSTRHSSGQFQQGLTNHTAYKQIGRMLAEAFGLVN